MKPTLPDHAGATSRAVDATLPPVGDRRHSLDRDYYGRRGNHGGTAHPAGSGITTAGVGWGPHRAGRIPLPDYRPARFGSIRGHPGAAEWRRALPDPSHTSRLMNPCAA